ncbi:MULTISPECIES: hypothetical protein [Bradyrhizobium]|uniref:hypothetical protein n=1 Tax=Bradyrhizobium centrosematis TaxID=1300039 RepID=UPI002168A4BC|nr:hypothetical protein [Bradyrhizobium centrosematis]MCS3765869.1 hypothetical protein [Bradyrhizobium centrosematis]MCS3778229.1 hypothetical protein [Bradyrhizobium centrosematis]
MEALRHPRWIMECLQHGTPFFANWTRYADPNASAKNVADFLNSQFGAPMTWKRVERYRELWKAIRAQGNHALLMMPSAHIR